jgi:hypothetical protein
LDGVAEVLDALGKAKKAFEGMDLIEEVSPEFTIGSLGFEYIRRWRRPGSGRRR